MKTPSEHKFSHVVQFPRPPEVLDLTKGFNPVNPSLPCGIGRYNEKRENMYKGPLYQNGRNIHIGVDFWLPAGSDVFAFYGGKILFFRDNASFGDYGPTIVTEHLMDNAFIYALYGHLSRRSLENLYEGRPIKKGEKIAEIGKETENGGWIPHLHFQLSRKKPKEPDMPGVVTENDLKEALMIYPDPQLVLGPLY